MQETPTRYKFVPDIELLRTKKTRATSEKLFFFVGVRVRANTNAKVRVGVHETHCGAGSDSERMPLVTLHSNPRIHRTYNLYYSATNNLDTVMSFKNKTCPESALLLNFKLIGSKSRPPFKGP